jgi:predicted transcriptional regulator
VARHGSDILTEREAQIMNVLWTRGAATAEQVRAALPGRLHDSTVRTLLRILESKGYVLHEARGKSYQYRPAVKQASIQRNALRSFLARLFGGSAESLVLHLIEDEALTPAELEEIRRSIPPRKSRRHKGDAS